MKGRSHNGVQLEIDAPRARQAVNQPFLLGGWAAVHGDQFRAAGFGLIVQGLAAGSYDLAVFPWSNVSGSFAPPKSIRLDVR